MARARAKALRMLRMGFLGVFGQWLGFTVTIYGIYDWNEMEPWTWIFCKWWLCLISFVFRGLLYDGGVLLLPQYQERLGVLLYLWLLLRQVWDQYMCSRGIRSGKGQRAWEICWEDRLANKYSPETRRRIKVNIHVFNSDCIHSIFLNCIEMTGCHQALIDR